MEKTVLPNLQDAFLNQSRRERLQVTIYLLSGIKLTGRIKGFDKYCVIMDGGSQEQLIFKHAISTVALPKGVVSKLPLNEDEAKEEVAQATTTASPAK
ncbi:MAG: RNA chaperone Hfq [Acidobacteria bacterium]|nr:RNA chaperone Hfq [Acidobacteriota bacterium]